MRKPLFIGVVIFLMLSFGDNATAKDFAQEEGLGSLVNIPVSISPSNQPLMRNNPPWLVMA